VRVAVYNPGDYSSPASNYDFLADMYKGVAKSALLAAFRVSSEEHVVIGRKPEAKVWVTKNVAAGSMKLAPLSNSVSIVVHKDGKPHKIAAGQYDLGHLFSHDGDEVHGYVKGHIQFPSKQSVTGSGITKSPETFIAAFWACRIVHDQSEANVIVEGKAWQVKVGRDEHTIVVPIMSNTKAIREGDEVVVYQKKAVAEYVPTPKVAAKGKGASKSSVKVSGKGKGKK
jgi:hypothetical protein